MKLETLLSALSLVREKISSADTLATNWLAERDRRRRQEGAILRGIVRAEGSQRKAAKAIGVSQATISRTIDPLGHKKAAKYDEGRRAEPSFQKLGSLTAREEAQQDSDPSFWKLGSPAREKAQGDTAARNPPTPPPTPVPIPIPNNVIPLPIIKEREKDLFWSQKEIQKVISYLGKAEEAIDKCNYEQLDYLSIEWFPRFIGNIKLIKKRKEYDKAKSNQKEETI